MKRRCVAEVVGLRMDEPEILKSDDFSYEEKKRT